MISSSYCCSHGLNSSLCCHSTVSHRITSPPTQSTEQSLTLHNDPFNRSYFRRIDSKDALGIRLRVQSRRNILRKSPTRIRFHASCTLIYIHTPRDCHTRAAMAKMASLESLPLSGPLTEHLSILPFGDDPVNPFPRPSFPLSLFHRTSSHNEHVQSYARLLLTWACPLHL